MNQDIARFLLIALALVVLAYGVLKWRGQRVSYGSGASVTDSNTSSYSSGST